MSYFLFVDESGHDRKLAPAEVLGGFAIRDGTLWAFIQAVYALQIELFGVTYPGLNAERRAARVKASDEDFDIKEIKGGNFLNHRVFKSAGWFGTFKPDERRRLAEFSLRNGASADKKSLSALAQAKLEYVKRLFELCPKFRAQCLGIIVPVDAQGDRKVSMLRKDYAYLFERFFYWVDSKSAEHAGIIVFDELDKSASHILLGQMQAYYRDSKTGQDRSERLVPEPLFVHSDLTVGIQLADMIAYVLSWGHGFDRKTIVPKPRPELFPYVKQVESLRIDSRVNGAKSDGIYVVYDLRTRSEKDNASSGK
ncbi:MAG TPA: DUF3800 domain-containing protein [Elusimicrobia bacterium]|nr:MAG: hypothetical protein A2X37_04125 [Elusimicrobia bacterium GWA2_66_18]OGR68994.1 MAG: hypothetical protein A2X40_10625 [Elusimicrobia bacterium GWC2_65_9]HAZ07055.1 DUF3800 domain-containing protein [Elusimicrobiota bacterium]